MVFMHLLDFCVFCMDDYFYCALYKLSHDVQGCTSQTKGKNKGIFRITADDQPMVLSLR